MEEDDDEEESEEEETLIGSDTDKVSIQLTGSLIAPVHVKITKRSDNYYIKPVDFNLHVLYLNGKVINNHDELRLNHGDRIIFGDSRYFRFNNPLNKQQSLNANDQLTASLRATMNWY